MRIIKVLIVDDHVAIRAGLGTLLNHHIGEHKFIIDDAASGEEAIMKVKKSTYDIAIVDYQMPRLNGAQTTKAILASKPKTAVIALSGYNEPLCIRNMMKAGAKGYILKTMGADEIVKGIITVVNKKNYFPKELVLRSNLNINPRKIIKALGGKKLSEKEISIIKSISEGFKSQQIAEKLCLTKYSIDKYRKQLLKKLEVSNTIKLLLRARELKLID